MKNVLKKAKKPIKQITFLFVYEHFCKFVQYKIFKRIFNFIHFYMLKINVTNPIYFKLSFSIYIKIELI